MGLWGGGRATRWALVLCFALNRRLHRRRRRPHPPGLAFSSGLCQRLLLGTRRRSVSCDPPTPPHFNLSTTANTKILDEQAPGQQLGWSRPSVVQEEHSAGLPQSIYTYNRSRAVTDTHSFFKIWHLGGVCSVLSASASTGYNVT